MGIHFCSDSDWFDAQVDSSIGGKTGVNTLLLKIWCGTFAQPDGFYFDPFVLKRLKRELIKGMVRLISTA